MSLAKVSGGDFSRAFLNQVELGRSQPSTRVLRVIAGRLGTEVEYLLEGRAPGVERELALERARVLLATDSPRRALSALAPAASSADWPLATDVRLVQAEALRRLGRVDESNAILESERAVIAQHRDTHRLARLRSLESEKPFVLGRGDPASAIRAHLALADRAVRAGREHDALEHFRAARVLLELRGRSRT
jgi:transcriptional regulator with XRE-family HTH domain